MRAAMTIAALSDQWISILEALEAGATLADGSQDIEQVARRPGQPIKPRHQQHVAGLEPADDLGQLGPVRLGAADLLLEDLGATGTQSALLLRNRHRTSLP
jgi:hypothetical protein